MTHIIAIANQKGGVGKTTTARCIAQGLAHRGKKILAIDLDPQRNLTLSAGAYNAPHNVLELMLGVISAQAAVYHTDLIDVIPATTKLSQADLLFTDVGKEYTLKEAIEQIVSNYDYVILDTPPALGILTVNALTAATDVIITAEADVYSINGINDLNNTITAVKKYSNHQLSIMGIVITKANARSILFKDLAANLEKLAASLGTIVFSTRIRTCTALSESNLVQKDIYTYAPRSNAAKDYTALVNEIINGKE